ncbi:hypothetical protein L596_025102 [Steinernema carpocapsae]|uniref:Uncharacterized protein n=1 Tax=Steinernema carpocapsae TaxID=34508 RepID=A0A4U5M6T8_STECR|nr:hypothetical protein L596_025102 [Steinernema carpocapsae]
MLSEIPSSLCLIKSFDTKENFKDIVKLALAPFIHKGFMVNSILVTSSLTTSNPQLCKVHLESDSWPEEVDNILKTLDAAVSANWNSAGHYICMCT